MPPDVLVDPEDGDAVEPSRVADQHSTPLGQHRVVGGVPGHVECVGDPGDGELLDHQGLQRPPDRRPREFRARRRRGRGVLPPDMSATGAAVAADHELQRRRTPPERLMRELPHDAVARSALATATPAPVVVGLDPAGDYRSVRLDSLPDGAQPEPVEAGESRQVRGSEGSVKHVEVFRMSGVGTFILGGPRPTSRPPAPSTPQPTSYTLNCEEPGYA